MMTGIGSGFLGLAPVPVVSLRRVLVSIAAGAGSLVLPNASIADPLMSGPASGWQWRLAGVIAGPGLSEAMFAHAGETRTLREGQQIDGWTMVAVRPHGVTLKGAGGEKILSPEGLSPDEEAAAASVRAEQNAQVAAMVSADSLKQQREQQAAEAALAEATKQMMAH
jgi:hypothetical protein